jgi:hypothetical protein
MKKLITSLLAIMLTGCSTLLDKIEEPLKPTINESNYWKVPCFWDGTKLKKPYEPHTN